MPFHSVPILLFATAFLGTAQIPIPDDPQPYNDPEAYNVYTAVIPQHFGWSVNQSGILSISEPTVPYEMCLKPDEASKLMIGSAIANYTEVNEKRWRLAYHFAIGNPYRIVPPNQLGSLVISEPGQRNTIPPQAPAIAGYMEFSAVGFNPLKTIAVVYAGHHCGSLCGGGEFYVLQKVNDKWQPLRWNGMAYTWAS